MKKDTYHTITRQGSLGTRYKCISNYKANKLTEIMQLHLILFWLSCPLRKIKNNSESSIQRAPVKQYMTDLYALYWARLFKSTE